VNGCSSRTVGSDDAPNGILIQIELGSEPAQPVDFGAVHAQVFGIFCFEFDQRLYAQTP
jgi:hypothetical protein